MEDFKMYSHIQNEKAMGYSRDAVTKHLGLSWRTIDKYWEMTPEEYQELTGNFVWIDKAYNILLLGGSGLGKSFLACYLGYKAIEAGYNVIFVSMNNLAHLLRTEKILARSRTRLKRIQNCDLLILDEVGNAILDRQDANRFFQLVCDFYQQTSIILTSNKDFQEWTSTLGDAVMTTAVLDRVKCPPLSRHEFLIDPNTYSSHYAAICLAR